MIRVRRDQPALFVSDMHLSDAHPDTARQVIDALAESAQGVDFVFLLGDLFDAWVGDDLIGDAGCERSVRDFLALLRQWQAQGKAVYALHGNRDFLLGIRPAAAQADAGGQTGNDLQRACGVRLLPDPCVIELHGEPVTLSHGDALCTDDTDYQAFRRLARTPAWQAAFLAQPLAARLTAARAMREQSRQHTREKDERLMDVNPQAVRALLHDTGTRVLVHGHTHRPAHQVLDLDDGAAQRWVLPDWDAAEHRGGMLVARDGVMLPLGEWPEPRPVGAALGGGVRG